MGFSEVRREGEDSIILKSGNLLYFRKGEQQFQGGVGFLGRKSFVNNMVKIESVSTRVAFTQIHRITKRYFLKVIQIYAPTSAHSDEEVETMYEAILQAIRSNKTHYTIVMGDFNTKLGLVEERRETVLQSSDDASRYRQPNSCSNSNNSSINRIKEAIERNKGSKFLARDLAMRHRRLSKLKFVYCRIISSRPELLREVENFYGQLYTLTRKPTRNLANDPRARLTRHFTEDIPDVSLYEIRTAQKYQGVGFDGITAELLTVDV